MKDTVFPHQRGDREVVIRETFVAICESDRCAAALLELLRQASYHAGIAYKQTKGWVDSPEILRELDSAFSFEEIAEAEERLIRLGLVEHKRRRGRYHLSRFNARAVNEALDQRRNERAAREPDKVGNPAQNGAIRLEDGWFHPEHGFYLGKPKPGSVRVETGYFHPERGFYTGGGGEGDEQ